MAFPYKKDWLLLATELDSTNNGFVITETTSGTKFTVSADTGLVFPHRDSTTHTTRAGLFYDLEQKLAATAAVNTYTFEAWTPTDSWQQLWHGIRLNGGITDSFTLNFSDVAFTLDPRFFGFPAGHSTDEASSLAGLDNALESPFQMFGAYRSVSRLDTDLDNAIGTLRKYADEEVDIEDSHDRAASRFAIDWGTDVHRRVVYSQVPAAHVFERMALDSDDGWYEAGGVAEGDNHNAFQFAWRALMRNTEAIMLHDVGQWDLLVESHASEVVKRAGAWPKRFTQFVGDPTLLRGLFFDLDISLEVVAELGGYNH